MGVREDVRPGLAYPDAYLAGLRLFNEGKYFECHEVLEDLWRVTQGPDRELYQGLIQLAVALHHLTRGNLSGSASLLASCKNHLAPLGATRGGLDLTAIGEAVDALIEEIHQVRSQMKPSPDLAYIPSLWPEDALP